jgi:hypothetical protein
MPVTVGRVKPDSDPLSPLTAGHEDVCDKAPRKSFSELSELGIRAVEGFEGFG